MIDLEGDLVDLGAALDVPADEHLATRVRAAIAQPPSPMRRRLVVALVALVLGGGGIAAAPVVADWLGVGGVEVKRAPPRTTLTTPDTPLDLGQRTTLPQARRDAGFDLVVPEELGAPDEVWVDTSTAVTIVWMAYLPRSGLPEAKSTGYGALFAQADESEIADEFWATKLARPDTVIESVRIGTGRALWVQGTHHLALRDHNGNVMIDELRLADNVVLWENGDVTLRFESALGRDDSLRIARSAR